MPGPGTKTPQAVQRGQKRKKVSQDEMEKQLKFILVHLTNTRVDLTKTTEYYLISGTLSL